MFFSNQYGTYEKKYYRGLFLPSYFLTNFLEKVTFYDGFLKIATKLIIENGNLILRIYKNDAAQNIFGVELRISTSYGNANLANKTIPVFLPFVPTPTIQYQEAKALPVTTTRMIELSGINKTITNEDDQHHFTFTNSNPITVTLPSTALEGMEFKITQQGTGAITAQGSGITLVSNLPESTTIGETRTFTKGVGNGWVVDGFQAQSNADNILSGNYSPQFTVLGNVSNISLMNATYIKVGNIVNVRVCFSAIIIAANVDSGLTIAMPINSPISSNAANLGSVNLAISNEYFTGIIQRYNPNSPVSVFFKTTISGGASLVATWQYQIN
jgi:hypothetical protein